MKKIVAYIVKLINQFLVKFGLNDETRHAFVKYFFNTGWMFAEKVLMLVVTFFVGIYVTRYLGPDRFGMLSYAYSFVYLFQAISKLGLDGIIVRDLVNNPQDKHKILGTSIVLKTIGSITAVILIIISLLLINTDVDTKILILIISCSMILSGFNSFQFYFEANVQAKYNSIVNVISKIIFAALKIIFVIIKADLVWFAVIYSIELIFIQILSTLVYKFKIKDIFELKFNKRIAVNLLKNSWPMIISSLAVLLYLRIDQIMIKHILNDKQNGLYSAAVSISEVWYFIPVVITNSVFPAIVNAKKKSEILYEKRLQQLYTLMSFIAVCITVLICIFGKLIVVIIYENAFSDAGIVLQIHILALVFVFLGQASSKWLLSENYLKISMYRTIAGSIFNIVANIFLIKYLGIIGAAISTVLSYMVAGFLFDVFCKKTHISFKMKCKSFNFFHLIKN